MAVLPYPQVHTLQHLHMHRELFCVMYGPRSRLICGHAPLAIPINPTRKMDMWDYEGSLSLQVRVRVGCGCTRVQVCTTLVESAN